MFADFEYSQLLLLLFIMTVASVPNQAVENISFVIIRACFIFLFLFFKLGFTPCKAEQSLQVMELQEKEAQKD